MAGRLTISIDPSFHQLPTANSPPHNGEPLTSGPPADASRWSPPTPSASSPITAAARIRSSLERAFSVLSPTRRSHSISVPPTTAVDAPTQAVPSPPPTPLTPLERFRRAGHHVVQMNRLRNALLASENPDPETSALAALFWSRKEPCVVEVQDYGVAHERSVRLDASNLEEFLAEPYRTHARHVRWINVTGLSWDVASALAKKYDLHPLSVEDIFASKALSRSKVDYYNQHVFLRVLCHLPHHHKSEGKPCLWNPPEAENIPEVVLETSKKQHHVVQLLASVGMKNAYLVGHDPAGNIARAQEAFRESGRLASSAVKRIPSLNSWLTGLDPEARERAKNAAIVEALKSDRRVNVVKRHVYIFLRRDGTVISFHESGMKGFFDSVTKRLKKSRSMLRRKPDASLLVHALLDRVTESTTGVIEEWREQMLEFERDMLINPRSIPLMRDLHVASGDLKLAEASVKPLGAVLRTLRLYDVDKAAALAEDQTYAAKNRKHVMGFISREAKIYMMDAEENVTHALEALESFHQKSERLLRYGFEMTGHATNDSTILFVLVSVALYPLSALAGYNGMNFHPDATRHRPEYWYWMEAAPMLVAIILFLSYQTHWWKWFRRT